MPKILPAICDCVIYLYRSSRDADDGKAAGASGFLVGVPSEMHPKLVYTYAVTARHVIEREDCLFVRLNTQDGKTRIIPTTQELWTWSENNDITVCPLNLDSDWCTFKYVPDNMFLTAELINEHAIGIGDDVFLVGRLMDHAGQQRNTPSARFGHISLMPFENVKNPWLRKEVEAYHCEVKSIGGFSGSPVFVHILPLSRRWIAKEETILGNYRGPWLLGVDWGHHEFFPKDDTKAISDDAIARNSGVCCVAPASNLAELLGTTRLRENRRLEDKHEKNRQAKSSLALDSRRHPDPD